MPSLKSLRRCAIGANPYSNLLINLLDQLAEVQGISGLQDAVIKTQEAKRHLTSSFKQMADILQKAADAEDPRLWLEELLTFGIKTFERDPTAHIFLFTFTPRLKELVDNAALESSFQVQLRDIIGQLKGVENRSIVDNPPVNEMQKLLDDIQSSLK